MARPKRRRLTVREHEALGSLTKRIREDLMSLATDIDVIAGSKAANHLRKSTRSLNMFRTMMDNWFCTDHPEQFDPRFYYGPVVNETNEETPTRTTEPPTTTTQQATS